MAAALAIKKSLVGSRFLNFFRLTGANMAGIYKAFG